MAPPRRWLPHCLLKLRREVADVLVVTMNPAVGMKPKDASLWRDSRMTFFWCLRDQYVSAAELALLQRVNVLERKCLSGRQGNVL